jgi:DNA-binding NarL/FixJ family response regulator
VRALVADDVVLFREGLARLLSEADIEVVGQAGDADTLLNLIATTEPDVAIVDIRMPPTHTTEGLEAAERIRAEHPGVAVLLLSHHVESRHAVDLIGSGSRGVGYLLKDRVVDAAEFLDAVRRVAGGGSVIDPEVVSGLLERRRADDRLHGLTDRELEVLGLMAQGLSNLAIGERLHVNERTVESHVAGILHKLGLFPDTDTHRRVAAVLHYLRQ